MVFFVGLGFFFFGMSLLIYCCMGFSDDNIFFRNSRSVFMLRKYLLTNTFKYHEMNEI